MRPSYPRFRKRYDGRRQQDIYEELEEQIIVLQNEVHNFITGPRSTENVTEWCKKELCWYRAQKEHVWTMNNDFLSTLVSTDDIEAEKKENKQKAKSFFSHLYVFVPMGSLWCYIGTKRCHVCFIYESMIYFVFLFIVCQC